mmetsp:Transcript_18730/g.58217  ORF Transcript_18730/g.58217 Transcript_18730/m.58217 type:complete len:315 (+) Transcript_18730:763-1707(+)
MGAARSNRSAVATTARPASPAAMRCLMGASRGFALASSGRWLRPMVMRSSAMYTSLAAISLALRRTAISADSLSKLARSAPLKPLRSLDSWSRSTSAAIGLLRACTLRTAARPELVGLEHLTLRSKRPARSSAGSSMSARLVAPTKITPVSLLKPSISVSSWLRVCSRSSVPPPCDLNCCVERLPPSASSSSTKITHGVLTRARLKRSRTRAAPTPTIASTNSDPAIEKNGTPASPAIARATSVLPTPGGPSSRMPLVCVAPSASYLSGLLRKDTTSLSSSMVSSMPATSSNLTPVLPSSRILARLCAKSIAAN